MKNNHHEKEGAAAPTPPPGEAAPPRTPAILVLGGTTEGYQLAEALQGVRVVSSLAGRTKDPRRPVGEWRSGGFGGSEGLARYLVQENIQAVVDATHPFARRMGWNAAQACQASAVPLLRLERPAWAPQDGDRWIFVDTWEEAVAVVAQESRRVLLALGRQEINPFAGVATAWFLIRCVDPPEPMPPFKKVELLLARGPFTLEGELDLLQRQAIDTIVCKNSGGRATDAKLAAARHLGLRVILLRRPPRPDVPTVATVPAALDWIARHAPLR